MSQETLTTGRPQYANTMDLNNHRYKYCTQVSYHGTEMDNHRGNLYGNVTTNGSYLGSYPCCTAHNHCRATEELLARRVVYCLKLDLKHRDFCDFWLSDLHLANLTRQCYVWQILKSIFSSVKIFPCFTTGVLLKTCSAAIWCSWSSCFQRGVRPSFTAVWEWSLRR